MVFFLVTILSCFYFYTELLCDSRLRVSCAVSPTPHGRHCHPRSEHNERHGSPSRVTSGDQLPVTPVATVAASAERDAVEV